MQRILGNSEYCPCSMCEQARNDKKNIPDDTTHRDEATPRQRRLWAKAGFPWQMGTHISRREFILLNGAED